MDKIHLENLYIHAYHGVFPEEKKLGQHFIVSCTCELDTWPAGQTDDLELSLNYGSLAHKIKEFFQEQCFDLLEAVTEYVAQKILDEFSLITSISLTVKKPSAPIGLPLDYPAVTIHRAWHPVILSLGSNMGDKVKHLDNAIDALMHHPAIRQVKESHRIETEPVGYQEQDNFLNSACLIETTLEPDALLSVIGEIEHANQRERTIHWGPRTLDIDIIYYDDRMIANENLVIPHPRSLERDFVMEPIIEIAPYWRDPRTRLTLIEMQQEK